MSIKKNISYNIIYQLLVMFLPLVTAPYLARIIGKEGIGVYSYLYAIVHYFVLFAGLGLANYGNRSIAQVRNNAILLNKTFSEIYFLQLIVSFIVLVLYLIFIYNYSGEYRYILFIQILHLCSSFFDISWFFYGIEQFKIMVIRNVIVKSITTAGIFLLVHSINDLWKYALIVSSSMFFSQFFLWINIKKFIIIKKSDIKNILKHLKPTLILFIPVIAVSLYRVMDKIMLGNFSTMEQTGLYENSDKLVTFPLTIIVAIGTVMMPRMSNLYANNQKEKVNIYLRDSMQLIFGLSCGMTFGLISIAELFIPFFYGENFNGAIILVKLLSPILIFSSLANVIRTQYLIPQEKDKIYIISVIVGATLNLIINYFFIPKYGAIGAVFGTLIAEFSVMIIQWGFSIKIIKITEFFYDSIFFIMSGFFMRFLLNFIDNLLLKIIMGTIFYGIFSIVLIYFFQRKRFIHLISLLK